MEEIFRFLVNVWGANGTIDGFAPIGSLKNGNASARSKDLNVIASLDNFLQGLSDILVTNSANNTKLPALQDLNSLFFYYASAVKYLYQKGIPEWIATENYFADKSYVAYQGKIYKALLDNINKDPTIEIASWQDIMSETYSKTEIDNLLINYYTKSQVDSRFNNYSTTSQNDIKYSPYSATINRSEMTAPQRSSTGQQYIPTLIELVFENINYLQDASLKNSKKLTPQDLPSTNLNSTLYRYDVGRPETNGFNIYGFFQLLVLNGPIQGLNNGILININGAMQGQSYPIIMQLLAGDITIDSTSCGFWVRTVNRGGYGAWSKINP